MATKKQKRQTAEKDKGTGPKLKPKKKKTSRGK
jgi:hypothetical protein